VSWGTTLKVLGSTLVAAAALAMSSPMAAAQVESSPEPPPASASTSPYVGSVGAYVSAEDVAPYLRPGPTLTQPASGNPTVVSVGAQGDEAPPAGTAARSNIVTGWDFVGLSVMALGGVGGIGLLMGKRRSF